MIEILRLSHRIFRDKRISTHCALIARSTGAEKIYYSGQKDDSLEVSVKKVVEKFGGPFEIFYTPDAKKLIQEKKKQNYFVIHLTVYGTPFEKEIENLKDKNILVVIGGEKVEPEYYEFADLNLSVSTQPHSEVSALGIFLYSLNGFKKTFKSAKIEIVPAKRGKLINKI